MKIIRIDEFPLIKDKAARWFSEKWDVSVESYMESINDSVDCNSILPKWYVVTNGDDIIAGAGVISNDIYNNNSQSPNVCAVYVEEAYRGHGLAGMLLQYICIDMAFQGINTLYLITTMNMFYERYGWEFMTFINDSENNTMRLYRHIMDMLGRCLL